MSSHLSKIRRSYRPLGSGPYHQYPIKPDRVNDRLACRRRKPQTIQAHPPVQRSDSIPKLKHTIHSEMRRVGSEANRFAESRIQTTEQGAYVSSTQVATQAESTEKGIWKKSYAADRTCCEYHLKTHHVRHDRPRRRSRAALCMDLYRARYGSWQPLPPTEVATSVRAGECSPSSVASQYDLAHRTRRRSACA